MALDSLWLIACSAGLLHASWVSVVTELTFAVSLAQRCVMFQFIRLLHFIVQVHAVCLSLRCRWWCRGWRHL